MDGCGFIVSLALWVWVGSGKDLLMEEAWLVRVPGDKGLSFYLWTLQNFRSPEGRAGVWLMCTLNHSLR